MEQGRRYGRAIATARAGGWRHASEVLVDMRRLAVQMDVLHLNAVLSSLGDGKAWSKSLLFLHRLGVELDLGTIPKSIQDSIRGAFSFAFEVLWKPFESFFPKDTRSFNIARSCQEWRSSSCLLQEQRQRAVGLSEVSLGTSAASSARAARWWDALQFLEGDECVRDCEVFVQLR